MLIRLNVIAGLLLAGLLLDRALKAASMPLGDGWFLAMDKR